MVPSRLKVFLFETITIEGTRKGQVRDSGQKLACRNSFEASTATELWCTFGVGRSSLWLGEPRCGPCFSSWFWFANPCGSGTRQPENGKSINVSGQE